MNFGVLITILTLSLSVEALMPSPWVDNSMCLPSDPPASCKMKKTACAPINQVLSTPAPGGGLISSIMACANSSGAVLDLSFFLTIGMAYAQGKPESLVEKASTDPLIGKSLQLCVLNSTGMLGSDLKLNRSAILTNIASQPLTAEVALPVAKAVMSCPEPIDGIVSPFMICLRKACMDNVSALPATASILSGAQSPPGSPIPAYYQPGIEGNPNPGAVSGTDAPPIWGAVGTGGDQGVSSQSPTTMSPEVAQLLQNLVPNL